jgi:hypothetical protein
VFRFSPALAFVAITLPIAAIAAPVQPLVIPFDSHHDAIGFDVTVRGAHLHVILDTGLDPSAIDTAVAERLKLPLDRKGGDEAEGEGAGHTTVYPSSIDNLRIGSRQFAKFEALAMDMSALTKRFGKTLDGVLGYSFLRDKIVLIDYRRNTVSLLSSAGQAKTQACRKHYAIPLRSNGDDRIPVISVFRIGKASLPASLDTGSSGGVTLYKSALDLSDIKAAFAQTGTKFVTGARGDLQVTTGTLNSIVGFGPFELPPGQIANTSPQPGSRTTRMANIGNKLFRAMKLQILLDYPAKTLTFYGDCGGVPAGRT